MRRHYSFVVTSTQEVEIPELRVFIGRGSNAFTVTLEDVEGFVGDLEAAGVKVIQKNVLDEFEPVRPEHLLPPGDVSDEILSLEDTHEREGS